MSGVFAPELPVAGRPVTVFGTGACALGAVAALRDAGADVTVVGRVAAPAVADLASRRLLTWHDRDHRSEDLDEPWLVVAATGSVERDREISDAAERRRLWCVTMRSTAPSGPGAGEVVLVGGGPGDPGLLTVAGVEALGRADVVVVDRLAPLAALTQAPAHAQVVDVSKVPGGASTPQEEINRLLVDHATAGRRVVRLKGGDGFVFGRGGEELIACLAAGVDVRVVPGVSSALAVPSVAGIPVTHRGLNQGFSVVSGHVAPDDPACTVDYTALAASGTDLVLLMAVRTLPAITRALLAGGRSPDTPAATVADGTLPSQRTVRGTLCTIAERVAEEGIRPPAITVIGAVAGFDPRATA